MASALGQKRALLAQMKESSGSRLMRASVGCWLSAAANGAGGGSSIELNHIGTERISAFHQSQELSIGIATRSCVPRQSHKESTRIAIRSCVRGQSEKEFAKGRDRNAFSIIEHRYGAAAAIDDRKGKDPAIGSAGRITVRSANFRSR